MGLQQICKGLEHDGILTGAGRSKWRAETIKKMLKNEKYMGDALLQKTYTVDVLNKKRVANNGIVPQYYVENNHEPIIPREIFLQAQEEMIRRSNLKAGNKKRVYSSKYALSSMVFCSKCGDIYRRVAWNNHSKHSIVWRCCNRVENGPKACDAETISETDLKAVVVKAFNVVYREKDTMLDALKQNLKVVLERENNPYTTIDEKIESIQKEIILKANSRIPYDELAEELSILRKERVDIQTDEAEKNGLAKRIREMTEYLDGMNKEIEDYDETLVRSYIEKITVFENRYEVKFKTGQTVEIRK